MIAAARLATTIISVTPSTQDLGDRPCIVERSAGIGRQGLVRYDLATAAHQLMRPPIDGPAGVVRRMADTTWSQSPESFQVRRADGTWHQVHGLEEGARILGPTRGGRLVAMTPEGEARHVDPRTLAATAFASNDPTPDVAALASADVGRGMVSLIGRLLIDERICRHDESGTTCAWAAPPSTREEAGRLLRIEIAGAVGVVADPVEPDVVWVGSVRGLVRVDTLAWKVTVVAATGDLGGWVDTNGSRWIWRHPVQTHQPCLLRWDLEDQIATQTCFDDDLLPDPRCADRAWSFAGPRVQLVEIGTGRVLREEDKRLDVDGTVALTPVAGGLVAWISGPQEIVELPLPDTTWGFVTPP